MTDETNTLYCANHPTQETSLRCNRCEKPVCSKCIILTPTGYRCKQCVQGQKKTFETARWIDYPLAFFTAAILSFFGSWLASKLGFFTIFIAPIAGTVIGEAVRLVVRRRRAKLLYQLAAGGALAGSLPIILISLLSFLFFTPGGISGLFWLTDILWPGLFAVIVTSTVYYRLAGMVFKR